MVPGVCRCTNRVGAKVNRRMGEVVSTFINVELKGASYIIFVLGEFRYGGAIQRALKKALPEFAEEMAVAGRLVQPYSRRSAAVAEEMHGKHWPEPIRQRIQNQEHPFVVMTKEGFESFDPRWHDWRIIWFASARGPTNSIPSLFQLLGRLIVQGGDVFGHLTTIGLVLPACRRLARLYPRVLLAAVALFGYRHNRGVDTGRPSPDSPDPSCGQAVLSLHP